MTELKDGVNDYKIDDVGENRDGGYGVSVVACTNKPSFADNIFVNYSSQRWAKKELIIILNNDSMNLSAFKKHADNYSNVRIYQLPGHESLGACLNFAVQKAKYDYIAKFDDDDYYAPMFLTESMQAFQKTNADLVGKRSYFIYLFDQRLLMLRHPARENRWCPLIAGGTIVAKRKVMQAVPFVEMKVGTAFQFVIDCRKKGFRIYSSSRFNYTYIRRETRYHTWNPNIKYFFKTSKVVAITSAYWKYANQEF